jgi:copper chaperone CopZ
MTHYIHHVPGRLRVKSLMIKKNETQARLVKDCLNEMNGVRATEVNTVTGSIVVNYDAHLVHSETILNSLRDQGYIDQVTPHSDLVVMSSGASLAQKVSDAVVNKLVETVVERSAVALIAALI